MQAGRVQVAGPDPERPQVRLPSDFALRELLAAPPDSLGVLALMQEWGLLVEPDGDGSFGLGAARRRLWELQALGRHTLAWRAGDTAGERDAWTHVAQPTLDQARERFSASLDAGLAGLRVHLQIGPPGDLTVATLDVAVAVQLAGYLDGSGPIPRCANLRCTEPFTVQRSTRRSTDSTPHLAGVRYCDRLCAKAQSERERRARRTSSLRTAPRGPAPR